MAPHRSRLSGVNNIIFTIAAVRVLAQVRSSRVSSLIYQSSLVCDVLLWTKAVGCSSNLLDDAPWSAIVTCIVYYTLCCYGSSPQYSESLIVIGLSLCWYRAYGPILRYNLSDTPTVLWASLPTGSNSICQASYCLRDDLFEPVAAPKGRSRVGFNLCEVAERRRREGSRRRDERRRREGRGAIGAEGGRV